MFILFLESMWAYFFWSIPYVIPGITFIFSIYFLLFKSNYFVFNKANIIPACLFFITLLYTKREQNINGFIGGILPFVSVFLIFSLRKKYKAFFIETLTRSLSIILVVSLFVWILVQIGITMPHTTLIHNSSQQFILRNYYVFIEYIDQYAYQRFMSIFIEPGYLGTMLSIILYINNFELKRKEILIIFISFIFTFSIAGYLMLFIAYISFLLKNKTHAIRYILFSFLILIVSYNLLLEITNQEVINELITSRLNVNDEGRLSGYNRTDEEMDDMFIKFLNSDDKLIGIGQRYEHFGSNVGYKPFVIINGIIGLLLLITSYLSGWFLNKRLNALIISILFIMIFSKGHSEIFWAGYLMLYATTIYMPWDWRYIYILRNPKKDEIVKGNRLRINHK